MGHTSEFSLALPHREGKDGHAPRLNRMFRSATCAAHAVSAVAGAGVMYYPPLDGSPPLVEVQSVRSDCVVGLTAARGGVNLVGPVRCPAVSVNSQDDECCPRGTDAWF